MALGFLIGAAIGVFLVLVLFLTKIIQGFAGFMVLLLEWIASKEKKTTPHHL